MWTCLMVYPKPDSLLGFGFVCVLEGGKDCDTGTACVSEPCS